MRILLPFERHPACASHAILGSIITMRNRSVWVEVDARHLEPEATRNQSVGIPSDEGNFIVRICARGNDLGHVVLEEARRDRIFKPPFSMSGAISQDRERCQ